MSKKPNIFRSPNRQEFWIDEGIYVTEIMNTSAEPAMSLARCRLPTGQITQLHRLSVTEWYIIESGIGVIEIDGKSEGVKLGDCVRIEKGQAQRIKNTGDDDLVFMTLCRPRFTPECYTNLEETDES